VEDFGHLPLFLVMKAMIDIGLIKGCEYMLAYQKLLVKFVRIIYVEARITLVGA
jgi:hypothetical protein